MEKEYQILVLKNGLNGESRKNVKEISQILHTDISTIYRLEKSAKEKLKENRELWLKWDSDISKLDAILTDELIEKEYQVLVLKYGLNDEIKRSNEEITKILGISIVAVNVLEQNAKEKLKENRELWLKWDSDINKLDAVLPEELMEKEYQVLVLRYGLNGESRKSVKEISQILGISLRYVYKLENAAKEKLQKNKNIWLKWDSDISKIDIIFAEELTEKEYQVLVIKYGLNEGKKKTNEEVSQILGISSITIYKHDKNAKEKLLKNKNIWLKWDSDINKVNIILNAKIVKEVKTKKQKLKEKEYQILVLKNGLNGESRKNVKEISQILHTDISNVYRLEKSAKEKLKENRELWLKWDSDISKLDAILTDELIEKEYQVLVLKYGLNDEIKRSNEEITKILGISIVAVNVLEQNAKEKLKENRELWLKWDSDINKLDAVLPEELTEKEYQVLVLRYGLNDGIRRSGEEITKILGVSLRTVYRLEQSAKEKLQKNKNIWLKWDSDINKINIILENKINNKIVLKSCESCEPFYSLFSEFSKEKVFWAFVVSDIRVMEHIFKRHGENLNELIPYEGNYRNSYQYAITVIEKRLKGLNVKESFIQKYKKEQFISHLNILSELELSIFKLFHGENFNEHLIVLGDSVHTVAYYCREYKNIIIKLEKEIKKKEKKFKKLEIKKAENKPIISNSFEIKLGYSIELAIKYLPLLLPEYQNIIYLRYGKSLQEFNPYPKDTKKQLEDYKRLENEAIYNLKITIRENNEKEEKIEKERILLVNEKKRIELREEKIRLKKEKMFNELVIGYQNLVSNEVLTRIIDSTVVDENISDFEYKLMIEQNLISFLANSYRENAKEDESFYVLINIISLFETRIKENNKQYTEKQIEDAIELVFESYTGEKFFEEEVLLYLRKS